MNEQPVDPSPQNLDHSEPSSIPLPVGLQVERPDASAPGQQRLVSWLIEGFRAAFFLQPRVAGLSPRPPQVFVVFLLVVAIDVALSRLNIAGPANFNLQVSVSGWWTSLVFVGLAWWAIPPPANLPEAGQSEKVRLHQTRPTTVPACMLLWMVATLPASVIYELLTGAMAQGWIKPTLFGWPGAYWAFYILFYGWTLGATIVLVVRSVGRNRHAAVFVSMLLLAAGLMVWQFRYQGWEQDFSRSAGEEKPRLHLTQEVFEEQQALWQNVATGIAPERPGVRDVYSLVFAPYASEEVFRRESTMVRKVLEERFDATGRTIHLLNHASTAKTHPWATVANMERAIDALAARMDRDNDVLFVYMTSHGASDFKLAASNWPLEVESLTPHQLRAALDKAGIRNRVIAISACYSGGWVDALASDSSLVMTAADATHTSYGCGRLSELTFFGRAVFDEQLRKTHSLENAFAAAVPVIRQRETDAGKSDGFSNPQIRVGAAIAPVLRELEQRLDALPPNQVQVTPAPAAMPSAPAKNRP